MTPLRVMTPGAPKPTPAPRWPWVLLALGVASAVFALEAPAVVLALVSGCALGYWLEERLFIRFTHRSFAVRSVLLWGQSVIWLPGIFVAALLAFVPRIHSPLEVAVVCGLGWFSSASLGSFATLAIDRSLSATPTRFRTRLMLAIFILMVLSLLAGLLAGALAFEAIAEAWAGTLKLNGNVDLGATG